MKSLRILLSASAAAAAVAMLLPADTDAFALNGSALSLGQRDVRAANNFTDGTLDNTTEHPNFPGYVGVEMAFWKSGIEWGSRLHGDGEGDTSQAGGLGSGGANFDVSFQGTATGIGGTNDNIHSQLTGNGGGVYAFAEGPYSNGWRCRYYSDPWAWDDGPGGLPAGRVDLQGIGTHEYGHCLGLNHTGVGGNQTMRASTSQSGSHNQRSIESDDILGVRAIYGVASADKPFISNLVVIGTLLEITGGFFDATDNEIWFTQDGIGGTGTPVKLFNVSSASGGTFISVIRPAAAGPGDVLVRRPGSAFDDLSNAWPMDPDSVPDFPTFCNNFDSANFFCPCGNGGAQSTGCDNSAATGGVGSTVTFFNPAAPSAVITTNGYPPMGAPTTITIRSGSKQAFPYTVFGDGMLCISVAGLTRLGAVSAISGAATNAFGHNYPLLGPGEFHYQNWYRNSGTFCTPDQFNLSSGISITWP